VPLHWRYSWDAYHVGLAGQGAAGTQGAAGFSPRGPSDGATAGIHDAGGIGGLLAVVDEAEETSHWYFYDGNGNVGQLLAYDAGPTVNATPAAHYEYDPYGHLINWTDTIANPFRFSTKWFDTTTGLGYWGYRHYSPRLGRWMSRDPIGEAGGVNVYKSLDNCANMLFDPHGLTPILVDPPPVIWPLPPAFIEPPFWPIPPTPVPIPTPLPKPVPVVTPAPAPVPAPSVGSCLSRAIGGFLVKCCAVGTAFLCIPATPMGDAEIPHHLRDIELPPWPWNEPPSKCKECTLIGSGGCNKKNGLKRCTYHCEPGGVEQHPIPCGPGNWDPDCPWTLEY